MLEIDQRYKQLQKQERLRVEQWVSHVFSQISEQSSLQWQQHDAVETK